MKRAGDNPDSRPIKHRTPPTELPLLPELWNMIRLLIPVYDTDTRDRIAFKRTCQLFYRLSEREHLTPSLWSKKMRRIATSDSGVEIALTLPLKPNHIRALGLVIAEVARDFPLDWPRPDDALVDPTGLPLIITATMGWNRDQPWRHMGIAAAQIYDEETGKHSTVWRLNTDTGKKETFIYMSLEGLICGPRARACMDAITTATPMVK